MRYSKYYQENLSVGFSLIVLLDFKTN